MRVIGVHFTDDLCARSDGDRETGRVGGSQSLFLGSVEDGDFGPSGGEGVGQLSRPVR